MCTHVCICVYTCVGSFQTREQASCSQGSSVYRGPMVEKRIDPGGKAYVPVVPGREGCDR